MIAYFLLVHPYPKQFKRLFKSIYMPGNIYLIHVDKTSGAAMVADIAKFLELNPGSSVMSSFCYHWWAFNVFKFFY